MAPSQVLMDLDQQIKMETPLKSVAEKEDGNFLEIKDPSLRCLNNCEDNTFDMDNLSDQQKLYEVGDPEVDILDCGDTSARVTQDEDPDATEYSSSFGNTISGSDNGLNSNLSDTEVESPFHCDNGASSLFDDFDEVFRPRKKKLTAHWRRYIRPLLWRCKWIELRVNEFQSQALKYDKQLSEYSHRKQSMSGQVGLENSAARSVPLSYQSDRKQVMKRKSRKRLEDTVDLSSYMLHHSLFSYYENKKSEADGVSFDDDCGNQVNAVDQNANVVDEFGVNYEWPVLESRDGDNSLQEILWNIEVLQSRAFKLKTQINKLVTKNGQKFSSMDNSSLFMPADLPSTSARSPTFSLGNGDDIPVGGALYTPPEHISKYEIGDLVMTESAVSSFGEVASLPDIIESTVGLLSAVDVYLDRPQIGDCADIVDDVLIHNPVAEEGFQHFEKVNQHIEKPQDPATEQEDKESVVSPVLAPEQCPEAGVEPAAEPILVTHTATEQPVLRSCLGSQMSVPTNKRKRAGRRGGLGRWNAKKVYTRRSLHGKGNRRV